MTTDQPATTMFDDMRSPHNVKRYPDAPVPLRRRRMRDLRSTIIGCIVLLPSCSRATPPASLSAFPQGTDAPTRALGAIVGEWQSDTIAGTSARSRCAWSPQGSAVICEQTITTPGGVRHAVNVFATDPATGEHFYYGIVQPGEAIAPTPLDVVDRVWTYGGRVPAPNGTYVRTINDFTAVGRYSWRTESSADRVHWTVIRYGNAVLIGKIAP